VTTLLALAVSSTLAAGCGDDGGVDTIVAIAPTPEMRALAQEAEKLTDVHPRALGYRVLLAPATDDLRAQTDTKAKTVTLYLRSDDPAYRVAHDLAHETGHAYDVERMDDALRDEYLTGRGAPKVPWWPGGKRSDLDVGAGDFAEVFALCHAASPEFRSKVAPRPDDACAALPPGARRSMK
jgi:hypothetical protein